MYVDKLIHGSIRYLETMKARKDKKFFEVVSALKEIKFKSAELTENAGRVTIRYGQFFTSLLDRTRARMLLPCSNTIISELSVLEIDNWLNHHIPSFYGKIEIRLLSKKF